MTQQECDLTFTNLVYLLLVRFRVRKCGAGSIFNGSSSCSEAIFSTLSAPALELAIFFLWL